jgi:hypothetical protein
MPEAGQEIAEGEISCLYLFAQYQETQVKEYYECLQDYKEDYHLRSMISDLMEIAEHPGNHESDCHPIPIVQSYLERVRAIHHFECCCISDLRTLHHEGESLLE